MAWNESGNNGSGDDKDKDPWGNGRRSGGNQAPPDIDEVIKNLSKKFNSLFGGSGGGSSSSGGSPKGRGFSLGLVAGLIVVVAVLWGFSGFYIVDEAERGVVLRFGKVLNGTVQPGLHWNPPVVDEVHLVNISELNEKTYQNRAMLTSDENIIDIEVIVQYLITDPVNYVISVQNPELSLDNAAESAIRHEVGGNEMNQILTTGRDLVAENVERRLQNYMDVYNTGIFINQLSIVDAQPPEAVRPAFDDVIRAREDEERAQNEAQAYANQIIPEARGEAQRRIELANAYKAEVVAEATGDASRFNQLLVEYAKAPEVTRQRLYIDSIEDVLSSTSKIMVDVEGGNNMLYVPLDQILKSNAEAVGGNANTTQDLRNLANQLAPYLTGPSGNSVDRSRVNTSGRGVR